LRREKSAGYRQLGAAIAAQDTVAHDRRRQSLSGDARQHRWPTVGQKRNCRERRAKHNTRAQAEIFRERFVLANDAEPAESRDDVDATFGIANDTLTEVTGGGLKEGDLVILPQARAGATVAPNRGGQQGGPVGGQGIVIK